MIRGVLSFRINTATDGAVILEITTVKYIYTFT